MRVLKVFGVAILSAIATTVGAQERGTIRQLGAIVAKSTEQVTPSSIRPTANGVFVNEPQKRRVILFDNSLANFTVVADTTSATGNAYSGRIAGLIAYKGDSTLFTDPQSMSMLVLDANGKVVRVMAAPRSQDVGALTGLGIGGAVYDRGALIYRGLPQTRINFGPGGPGTGGFPTPEISDSAALVRVDLATRKLDTLTFMKTPKVRMEVQRTENGGMNMMTQINPLPVVDEWAMLPDGAVAILRGRDYHVDWINADGTKSSSAKIPFDWQRLSDEDKVTFLDSLKAARERAGAGQTVGIGGAAAAILGGGGGAPAVGQQMNIVIGGGGPGGGGGGNTAAGPARASAQLNFVQASELPDYKPAFFAGSTKADLDGNVWVRTIPTKPIAGGAVYDVINRKGELAERVQVPANSLIVGFGPGGDVYLVVRDGEKSFLAKAKIR